VKIVLTIELDNRHGPDAHLLETQLKGAVVEFNRRTRAEAYMKSMCLFSDDAEVLAPGPIGQRAVPLP
jgi:hypothetical protein